jgi:hypothetical protein
MEMRTNETPFDAWSLVHIASGYILGVLAVPLPQTLAGLVAFELLEWTLEHPSGSRMLGTKRPESQINVATDIGVALVAYGLARQQLGNDSTATTWQG